MNAITAHDANDTIAGCGLNIVLYEPEIPPNTGNIMRLAANTGAKLHLVGPLGFVLDNTRLARAGLDYRDKATCCSDRKPAGCLNRCWKNWVPVVV
jgi:tRNA(Leu) C34 or U34 (ribose-2'-O)-methylase TrmL